MASRGQATVPGQLTMSGLIDAWIEEDARKAEAQPERVDHYTTVTASKLRERGWTDAAIQRFAGTPAYTVPNPTNVTGTPSRLWKLSEIILIEETNEFRAWRAEQSTRYGSDPLDILRERLTDGFSVEAMSEDDLILAAFGRDHTDSCMLCDSTRIHDGRDSYLAAFALRHLLISSDEITSTVRGISHQSAMDMDRVNRMVASAKYSVLVEAFPTLMSHFARELNVPHLLWD